MTCVYSSNDIVFHFQTFKLLIEFQRPFVGLQKFVHVNNKSLCRTANDTTNIQKLYSMSFLTLLSNRDYRCDNFLSKIVMIIQKTFLDTILLWLITYHKLLLHYLRFDHCYTLRYVSIFYFFHFNHTFSLLIRI